MTYLKFINEDLSLTHKLKALEKKVFLASNLIYETLKNNNKIFICGNGGSAADAEHLSAEFLVRLRPKVDRKPLPVIALTQGVSTITACSNDYSYHEVFKRNFEAMSSKDDLLICLSTSGNSESIKRVLNFTKKKNNKSLVFFGNKKGKCHGIANLEILIPSKKVAKIQEAYMMMCHYIFAQVEDKLIKNYFD